MDTNWLQNNLETFLPPLLIIVFGILIGLIFKRYIHSRLKSVAKKSNWAGDDAVLDAIEPHIVLWFFLGALSIASSNINSVNVTNVFLKNIINNYVSQFLVIVLIGSITLAACLLYTSPSPRDRG